MVRSATVEDASRIAEILIFSKRTAYRAIFHNDKVSFGEMQVLPLALEYQQKPELLEGLYLWEEDVVKGLVRISTQKKADRLEIHELYLDPFFQKQGLGAFLLVFAETHALSRGVSGLELWVLEKNAPARKFYEKHGFSQNGQRKLQEGTSEFLLQYEKKIPSRETLPTI